MPSVVLCEVVINVYVPFPSLLLSTGSLIKAILLVVRATKITIRSPTAGVAVTLCTPEAVLK
jgi:hypothetical protein